LIETGRAVTTMLLREPEFFWRDGVALSLAWARLFVWAIAGEAGKKQRVAARVAAVRSDFFA